MFKPTPRVRRPVGSRLVEPYCRNEAFVFGFRQAQLVFGAESICGECNPGNLRRLCRLVDDGLVGVLPRRLPAVSFRYDDLRRFQGTEAHRKLCLVASRWLDGLGVPWEAESNYGGKWCDVAAADGSIGIECGDTNVATVQDLLEQGRLIMVVPYLDADGRAQGAADPDPVDRNAGVMAHVTLGYLFDPIDPDGIEDGWREWAENARKRC